MLLVSGEFVSHPARSPRAALPKRMRVSYVETEVLSVAVHANGMVKDIEYHDVGVVSVGPVGAVASFRTVTATGLLTRVRPKSSEALIAMAWLPSES